MPKLSERRIKSLNAEELKVYTLGEIRKLRDFFGAIQDLPEIGEWDAPEHDKNREAFYKIFKTAEWTMNRQTDHIPQRFLKKSSKSKG